MRILDIDPGFHPCTGTAPGVLDPVGQWKSRAGRDRFQIPDRRRAVHIRFADPAGKELDFQFESVEPESWELRSMTTRSKFCKNNCIFCFVHQQPQECGGHCISRMRIIGCRSRTGILSRCPTPPMRYCEDSRAKTFPAICFRSRHR